MALRFTEEEFAELMQRRAKTKSTKRQTQKQPNVNRFKLKPQNLPKEKETTIQNRIRDFLSLNGWFVIRHQQSLGSLKGLSDLTAIKDGITVYIEVKTPRGVQSEYQKIFQQNIESHGGIYILARGLEDVQHLAKGVNSDG